MRALSGLTVFSLSGSICEAFRQRSEFAGRESWVTGPKIAEKDALIF